MPREALQELQRNPTGFAASLIGPGHLGSPPLGIISGSRRMFHPRFTHEPLSTNMRVTSGILPGRFTLHPEGATEPIQANVGRDASNPNTVHIHGLWGESNQMGTSGVRDAYRLLHMMYPDANKFSAFRMRHGPGRLREGFGTGAPRLNVDVEPLPQPHEQYQEILRQRGWTPMDPMQGPLLPRNTEFDENNPDFQQWRRDLENTPLTHSTEWDNVNTELDALLRRQAQRRADRWLRTNHPGQLLHQIPEDAQSMYERIQSGQEIPPRRRR